ncbi:unnamed protein product [Rhizophagus irregularis]|nr:unnamed protein product [Rhizophagus irregularis]CAB5372517.1 unnamed protein product [Rhizophagus irregularis]
MVIKKLIYQEKANSAPLKTLPKEHLRLRTLLAKYNEDIYNADETGLFFRMNQNILLVQVRFPGENNVGLRK